MDSIPSFNKNTSIGAMEIGVLVSYVLLGVTITQVYIYYTRFPDDSRTLKSLVAFVGLCEIAHAVCIGLALYEYTVSAYGDPEDLGLALAKSFDTAVFFSGVIYASVQSFFSYRIYMLSKKIFIACVIWICIFLRFVGTAVSYGAGVRMASDPLPQYEADWGWLFYSIWSLSAAIDVAITITLVFLLWRQRTGVHQRTVAVVDKLIKWLIETGMLTSATAIATLACFVVMTTNFIWLAFLVVESRLYSNSLLASLNSRVTLRAMNDVELHTSPTTKQVDLSSGGVGITHVTHTKYGYSYSEQDRNGSEFAVEGA
ncbi:hypothetical protein MVEN_01423000 [Mycena venus]|uniref:DUF6534 domain-containing protein n=1 Tax=Mycena venus TaxID=2733690 RepID=A0A8H7CVM1_9AGAR|nr:hypothetical protein MVEN_01423000 [Mycena venus]